ncbi:hypothetical protein FA15DRAFT_665870, partial [Coprinopsis marcescibilis]
MATAAGASGAEADFAKRLEADLSSMLAKVLRDQPSLTPEQAMLQVRENLLQNNPFVPPKDGRCIINTIPVELLAHIFRLGVESDYDDAEREEVKNAEEKKSFKGLEGLLVSMKAGVALNISSKNVDAGEKETEEEKVEDVEIVDDDGKDSDWEDEPSASATDNEGEDDDSEDEEDYPYDDKFEMLASHVCKHWRETAINTPDLWNDIEFTAPPRWDMWDMYLKRSKTQPLWITIDGLRPDFEANEHPDHPDYVEDPDDDGEPVPFFSTKELDRILDMVVPLASQWHTFDTTVADHDDMVRILKRLQTIPEAPILESLQLHDEQVCDEYEIFDDEHGPDSFEDLVVPFHGKAPKLLDVTLWGVHLDWDAAIPLLQGLRSFSLAYIVQRPSFRTYATYLKNSPQIAYLELDVAGPSLRDPEIYLPPQTPATGLPTAFYTPTTAAFEQRRDEAEDDPWQWPNYPLEVPSVQDIILGGHEPSYALALATKLYFPGLTHLTLSYDNGDFSEVIQAYSKPVRGTNSRRSPFQTLEYLRVDDLGYVSNEALDSMLQNLADLKQLRMGATKDYSDDPITQKIFQMLSNNAKMVQDLLSAEGDNQLVAEGGSKVAGPGAGQPLTIVPPEPGTSLPSTLPSDPASTPNVHPKLLLPRLEKLQTMDPNGKEMRELVARRKAINAPIKTVLMHRFSELEDQDREWLQSNVDEFDVYANSDSDDSDIDGEELGSEWDEGDDDDDDDDEDDDEDGSEWEDEDGNGDDGQGEWEDEDDDVVDEEGGGRVQRARGLPRASSGGQASSSVTTGLSNL